MAADTLEYLVAGVAFGCAGGFAPGPTLTLVIAQTLRHGLGEGVKVAIAPLLTDAPIILLSLFALSRIDAEPVLGMIAFAGAIFLMYLAYESYTARPPQAAGDGARAGSLRKGFTANLLNPHPWVFWLTVGAPIVLRAANAGTGAVILFLVGQYACLVGAKVLVAAMVEKGRGRLGRAYGVVMKFLTVVLAVYAVMFVREGLSRFGWF